MPDKIILAESYGSVLVDEKVPCVIVQFHTFANREQFKQIMDTGLAYHQAHARPEQPWGWVGDTRNMGAIPKEVQHWLTHDWNRRAYAAGIREISIVVSQNVMGQIATQQYATTTVAQQQQQEYEIAPVYYDSLRSAKKGAAQRNAILRAQS
jgi:hypothetical protein